ncbi:hypothetical protein [Ruegeria marina]|uniref:Uncharacterized protein n=1 Tax=Ruegeria marina TaxID=639004 RepID=A0A1G6IFD7_9RHOB|nr:hypothetical protein [Ruegeria marina]SDC05110.1 hypothetical protein SAMN04488239_101106 [Ruegeria marina]
MTRVLAIVGLLAAGAAAYYFTVGTEPSRTAVEKPGTAEVTPEVSTSPTLGQQLEQSAEALREEVGTATGQVLEQA